MYILNRDGYMKRMPKVMTKVVNRTYSGKMMKMNIKRMIVRPKTASVKP